MDPSNILIPYEKKVDAVVQRKKETKWSFNSIFWDFEVGLDKTV